MKRNLLIAAAVVLVLLLGYDQYRRQASIQVPATFARLQEAVVDHDASGVLACVDRSYDFSGKWPRLFPDPQTARGDAQRLLALAFLHGRQDELTCEWTLHGMTPRPDGSIQALVSLTVSGGPFSRAVPALVRHPFILVRGGWLSGYYRITDHAPFELTVPE